jgi:hypothetical protein
MTQQPNNVSAAGVLTPALIDSIMEQAQVFASAWSLVGGPFDSGDMLETAKREKAELRMMLAAASAQAAVQTVQPSGIEIWEYSYIHSSSLGRPDEKITMLTYERTDAFRGACFDQKLVCSTGVALAEMCEDADGFKHIEATVEDLDDIPAGTKMFASPLVAPASDSDVRRKALEEAASAALNASLDAIWSDGRLMDPREVGSACAIAIRALLREAGSR